MSKYIVIKCFAADGSEIDSDVYDVNTPAECEAAARALRDAGVDEAEVWLGEGADAVKSGMKLFAAPAD